MSNSTVIGTTSSFYGVATFQSQPIITSTILANNDNSTNIATTAWANSFLTYAQTQPNTWTGAQTFTTANVSVLNVFKTSVDTINASSITSDMTIGANLNGGSLTLGAAGATNLFLRGSEVKINEAGGGTVFIGNTTSGSTDINSNITNIGTTGLSATGRVNIGTGNNSTGSEMYLGSPTLTNCYIRGNVVNINDNGATVNLGKDNSGRVELRGSIVVLNGQGGDLNLGGVSSGTINLYRPLTVVYAPSAVTSLYQIGFSVSTRADNGVSTTARLYAPINNLPNGTYITHMYLYNSVAPSPTSFIAILAYANNPITNGQEGFTGLIYDGGHEIYGTTHRSVPWSIKGGGIYGVTSNTNRNIAIRAWTTDGYANETPCVMILQVTRLA